MLHDGHVKAQRVRAAALRKEAHAIVSQAVTLRAHGEEMAVSERINIGAQLEKGELLQRINVARTKAKERGEPLEGDEGLVQLVAGLLVEQAQRMGQQLVDVSGVIRELGLRTEGAAEEADRCAELLEGLLGRQLAEGSA